MVQAGSRAADENPPREVRPNETEGILSSKPQRVLPVSEAAHVGALTSAVHFARNLGGPAVFIVRPFLGTGFFIILYHF